MEKEILQKFLNKAYPRRSKLEKKLSIVNFSPRIKKMEYLRKENQEERLHPQQYNEMIDVKVDTIKEMFDSIKGLKMFKVTSSEIYVSSQDTNRIIIINRENFVESMFNLEEIDEPMNDNATYQPRVARFQPMNYLAMGEPRFPRGEYSNSGSEDNEVMNNPVSTLASFPKTDFMNLGMKEFDAGDGGGMLRGQLKENNDEIQKDEVTLETKKEDEE